MVQNDGTGQGYFRVPRALLTDKRYAGLSADAKLLYGLLLDRLCLSRKNNWTDKNGRTYIYFTIKEVTEMFHCYQGKAVQMLHSLDQYGLIERKRLPNRPTRIFVREFILVSQGEGDEHGVPDHQEDEIPVEDTDRDCDNHNPNDSPAADTGVSSFPPNQPQFPPYFPQAGSEAAETASRNCDSHIPDLRISQPSYPEYNYPESSNTFLPPSVPPEGGGAEDEIRETVYRHIDYPVLRQIYGPRNRLPLLDSVVGRILDALRSGSPTMRVNGEDMPAREVKARLMTLDDGHVMYAMDVLTDESTRIGNIRGYLLTLLYNAPAQADLWYDNKVRRDAERERAGQMREPACAGG